MSILNSINLFVLQTTAASSTGLSKTIYNTDKNNKLYGIGKKIIEIVGGVGAIAFTLAVMIIALVIIFGSIAPKNIGKWWTALFSCIAGAVLFFSAYLLADIIAGVF